MSDLTVYRSTKPDVVQRWLDARDAVNAWSDKLKTALADLGLAGRDAFYNEITGRIEGIGYDGGYVPDDWRVDRRTGYLVPRLTTKAGKTIDATLVGLLRPDPRNLPGMPRQVYVSLNRLTCGVEEIGGALYVKWSQPIPEDDVDLTVWERIKLSAYYAVLEARDDAEALPSTSTPKTDLEPTP